jgi:hypothetical protein
MKTMPLSGEIIRSLVEKCKVYLEKMLDIVGQYRIISLSVRPLRVQDIQRILKVARHTDSPVTLAGVAAALSNANFLRVAETELILKILRADSGDQLAPALFWNRRADELGAASLAKENGLIEKVARGVMSRPDDYPFRTVCGAAAFIVQYFPIELTPLLLLGSEKLAAKTGRAVGSP